LAPLLRTLTYRHRWIYDSVIATASLAVGNSDQLRQLGANAIAEHLVPGWPVLDLCCGAGDASLPLHELGFVVTGLDALPAALEEAARRCPSIATVEGQAESPPLPDGTFQGVQLSLALHEFTTDERLLVLKACHRLLTPGGWLVIVNLHPTLPALQLSQRLFCSLLETENARGFLHADLTAELERIGCSAFDRQLFGGGTLQRILARRSSIGDIVSGDGDSASGDGVQNLDSLAGELGSGGALAPEGDPQAYRKRMARRREVQQQRVASRSFEKGLVIVFTGHGKGKTTAALGMVLRTLGHGARVAVVQFIKGGWEPGEARALSVFGDAMAWHALGEGFTWETQDRQRDRELVQAAWSRACAYMADPERKLVVLDEVNVALKLGYLELDRLLEGLALRPPLTHVVLTGRGAPEALIDRADLVTEMTLVHHPFREQGVKAQVGIEY